MRSVLLCTAFMLFSYTTACAFNDPVDTVGPLTLRIEHIPPVERLNIQSAEITGAHPEPPPSWQTASSG